MRLGAYGNLITHDIPYRVDIGMGDSSDFITVGKIDRSRFGIFPYQQYEEASEIFWKWRKVKKEKNIKKLLAAQIAIESEQLPRIRQLWDKGHRNEIPVIEVANEPNAFPYISPEIYAWYYDEWYKKISTHFDTFKMMIGGLWIFYGLPNSISENLHLLGIKNSDTGDYLQTVLKNIKTYLPDVINLHFYPYVGPYDTLSLYEQNQYLKTFIDHYKKIGHQIWITEFGNLNPLSEPESSDFSISIIDRIKKLQIDRAYFFKARGGSDSKFQPLIDYAKHFNIGLWVLYILLIPLRIPIIEQITSLCLKIFRLPSVENLVELINIAHCYVKQVPIQCLEDEGKLNKVGQHFISSAYMTNYA